MDHDPPRIGDYYKHPDGRILCVISTHPPYISAKSRRGWAVTVLSEDARAYLITIDLLLKGGFSPHILAPATISA